MTAAEHKSDVEVTKDPVSRASYGVFVVCGDLGENTSLWYHHIVYEYF